MIKGIGTDLVEIARIKNTILNFGHKFLHRVFTKSERLQASVIKDQSQYHAFLAKRFAAKEAYAKALGSGIGSKISFNQIEVKNDVTGHPQIVNLKESSNEVVHLSLTDTAKYALAYVIIEG